MTPSIQDLLLPGGLRSNLFPPNSRYSGIDTNVYVTASGQSVIYLRRRFLPPVDRFVLLREHIVSQGERLDNITALYFTDPELFWRICDANNIMHPQECEQTGRRLRITLPEGIPGTPDA